MKINDYLQYYIALLLNDMQYFYTTKIAIPPVENIDFLKPETEINTHREDLIRMTLGCISKCSVDMNIRRNNGIKYEIITLQKSRFEYLHTWLTVKYPPDVPFDIPNPNITMQHINKLVAAEFKIRPQDAFSKSRKGDILMVRKLVTIILRLFTFTPSKIALFYNQSHATILHHFKTRDTYFMHRNIRARFEKISTKIFTELGA